MCIRDRPKVVRMIVICACWAWQNFACAPITGHTRSCGTKDKMTLKLSHVHTNHIERLCAWRAAFGTYIGVALAGLLDLLYAFSEVFVWPTILLFPLFVCTSMYSLYGSFLFLFVFSEGFLVCSSFSFFVFHPPGLVFFSGPFFHYMFFKSPFLFLGGLRFFGGCVFGDSPMDFAILWVICFGCILDFFDAPPRGFWGNAWVSLSFSIHWMSSVFSLVVFWPG